jgi:hypothetical protein
MPHALGRVGKAAARILVCYAARFACALSRLAGAVNDTAAQAVIPTPKHESSNAMITYSRVVRCIAWLICALPLRAAELSVAPRRETIEAGGIRFETERVGENGPSVVFELGAGGNLDTWRAILPRVGNYTTAFSYMRAGRGKSGAATRPRSPTQIVEELNALLEQAKIPPPYVLVGRSLGGIYVRLFAIKYSGEVAGLVLIDPSHERLNLELSKVLPDYAAMLAAQDPRPEIDAAMQKDETLLFLGHVPDVPTIIITSTRSGLYETSIAYKRTWRALHDELFGPVRNGMHIVTTRSGHAIQDHEPELVLNAIRWVVDRVRSQPVRRPNP